MYKMEPILLNQLKLILQPDHQVEDLQRRTLKDSVSIAMEYLLLLIQSASKHLIKMATALDLTFILLRRIK